MYRNSIQTLAIAALLLFSLPAPAQEATPVQNPVPETAPPAASPATAPDAPPATPPAQDPTAQNPAAPDGATATPAAPAVELPRDFEGLLAHWESTRSRMTELAARFEATSDLTEKDAIRVEYTALLDGCSTTLDRLRDSALAGLTAENLDPRKLNTLMGILVHEANSDRDDRVLATADTLIALGVPASLFETASRLDRLSIPGREIFEEILVRQREAAANDLPRVKITTNRGVIELELFENEAPNTVANFISLAKAGFYNGLKFHRVIEGFMAQGGDPDGNGTGGPGYTIACECSSPEARRHFTGSVSMAHAGRDTGGSQFFAIFTRSPDVRRLDGKHTVFGRVVSGFEVLESLTRTAESSSFGEQPIDGAVPDVMEKVEVVRDRGTEYNPVKVLPEGKTEEPATPPPANPPTGGTAPAADGGNPPDPAKDPASGPPAASPPTASPPTGSPPTGSPPTGSPPTGSPPAGDPPGGGGDPAGGGFPRP